MRYLAKPVLVVLGIVVVILSLFVALVGLFVLLELSWAWLFFYAAAGAVIVWQYLRLLRKLTNGGEPEAAKKYKHIARVMGLAVMGLTFPAAHKIDAWGIARRCSFFGCWCSFWVGMVVFALGAALFVGVWMAQIIRYLRQA